MSAKQALGRGLKALIPDRPTARAGFAQIPVDHVRPNPLQPRRTFGRQALANLFGNRNAELALQSERIREFAIKRRRPHLFAVGHAQQT